jgi:hypothetical protein
MKLSQLLVAGALAIAAIAASASGSQADVKYAIEDAVFDDGTPLTGYFVLNQYGYLESWDLISVAGTLSGYEYTPGSTDLSGGCAGICAIFGQNVVAYLGALQLTFADPFPFTGASPGANPLITGEGGPSWENYSYTLGGEPIRYLDSGFVISVPEPSTWTMMLLGFAGLGFAGYRKAMTARRVLQ